MLFPDRMFLGEWLRDPRLRALGRHLQLLLMMLRHLSDRSGRFEYSPADLHRALYVSVEDNVSARDVEEWLEKLRSLGFIKSYTGSNGRRVGEISQDYWRQKLSFGKTVFEAEGDEPQLDLSDPPPKTGTRARRASGSEEKRSDLAPAPSAEAGPARAGQESDFPVIPKYFSERLSLTLAELEGADPRMLTAAHKRAIGAAIRAIQAVKPDLHPDDLVRAAAAWKKCFPTASLTAAGMAKHWARLVGRTGPAAAAAPLIEEEPLGWRDWINENTPDAKYARGGELEGTPWAELDASYRRYLIEQCRKRDERGRGGFAA